MHANEQHQATADNETKPTIARTKDTVQPQQPLVRKTKNSMRAGYFSTEQIKAEYAYVPCKRKACPSQDSKITVKKSLQRSASLEYDPLEPIPPPVDKKDTAPVKSSTSGSNPEGDSDSSESLTLLDSFIEGCNFQETTISGIWRHIAFKHPMYRYQCDYCTHSFERYDSLQKYIRHHEGPKHTCTFCSRSFHEKHELEAHSSLHTGKFPFSCDTCGKGFGTKRSSQCHAAVHLDKSMPTVHQKSSTVMRTCNNTLKESMEKAGWLYVVKNFHGKCTSLSIKHLVQNVKSFEKTLQSNKLTF